MRYVLLLLMLTSCASRSPMVPIDYSTAPPGDWPKLEERIANISRDDMPKFCRGLGKDVGRAVSCAVTSFRYGVCYIYLATDDTAALEHERAHCRGYGHIGDATAPADAWRRFKASQ